MSIILKHTFFIIFCAYLMFIYGKLVLTLDVSFLTDQLQYTSTFEYGGYNIFVYQIIYSYILQPCGDV